MAYIGRQPTVGNFRICDAISVVNGQAAYTMQVGGVNVIPESANNMIVSLNGVIQKPGSSYTVSSSTITFSSNLSTGDVIDFIQILGGVANIGTPTDGTVTAAKLVNGAVSNAHLAGSIDLTSKVTGTLPLGNGGIGATTLAGAGIKNSAHFSARIGGSGAEPLANTTTTTIPFGGSEFDPDNVFDHSSTYKFTAPSAGKYYFNWCVRKSDFTANRFYIDVLKNDSGIATFENGGGSVYGSIGGSIVVDLAQNDTIHAVYYQNSGSSQNISRNNSRFCGFKLV